MKRYKFILKKGEHKLYPRVVARIYSEAILKIQKYILDGYIIETFDEEQVNYKYTLEVLSITPSVGEGCDYEREYVFYKTEKLSKEEQYDLVYDVDLEVDAPSYMGEDFEVAAFKVYEKEVWRGRK